MELFVRIFLISPHRNSNVSWKDVLHQPVNTTLTLTVRKKIISFIWPNILFTDSTIEGKQCLTDVALRTVRYSCRLYSAGTALLFAVSVNSTNITVHIFQCVTVINVDPCSIFPQDRIQHNLHTQDCFL